MPVMSWSREPPRRAVARLDPDTTIYVVSDLHLGDGTEHDIFLLKDRYLGQLIDQVEEEGATLVIAGDAIDFSQAMSFTRVLRAHGPLLRRLSELADKGRMIYVVGNHDLDLRLYEYLLRFPVVSAVEVGDEVLIVHGYEYDELLGPDLRASELNTRVHHLVERVLGTWIRPPLAHFYTRWNRFMYWGFHKVYLVLWLVGQALLAVGRPELWRFMEKILGYWMGNELGDPGRLARAAVEAARAGRHKVLVSGHSHLPGVVPLGEGRAYVNTGSWTFQSATCLRWQRATGPVLTDRLSGKRYDDRLYRPILEGALDHVSFLDWWADHYMGAFRFRCGEERHHAPPPFVPEAT